MSVLMQISDPHFGTEQAQVVDALMVLAQQHQPNLVVLSGDITQRARLEQFRTASAFMNKLRIPFLAIPGNHDIPLFDLWSRLRRPYARFTTFFGPELEPFYSSHDLMVICVNTTRAWRHKHGEISAKQIERVADILLKATPQQLRIVVVHQPIAVTRKADAENLLRGHAYALPRWSASGADLIMGGHIHLPYVLALHDHARPMWAVQAGTAVSSRVRLNVPNSVNLLRWGVDASDGNCHIEQWDYSSEKNVFVRAVVNQVAPKH